MAAADDRDAVWSAVAAAPEADHADLLLLRLERDFPLPEADCFGRGGARALLPCNHVVSEWRLHKTRSTVADDRAAAEPPPAVPTFVPVLISSMRWCMVSNGAE